MWHRNSILRKLRCEVVSYEDEKGSGQTVDTALLDICDGRVDLERLGNLYAAHAAKMIHTQAAKEEE
jgi:hypothetical protein